MDMSDYSITASYESKGIPKKSDGHFDLVSFFSVIQGCAIDLLPLTWQQTGKPLGRGGTAVISQSRVNLDTSFAFKRIRNQGMSVVSLPTNFGITDKSDESYERAKYETEVPIYKLIISELSILCHPAVRNHPNILSLQAICWEIYEESQEIWPVLIFPKSELGDLQSAIDSDRGAHMSTAERLKLCRDVAEAISALHENGIDNIITYYPPGERLH